MIKEAFLVCALALHVASFNDPGGHDSYTREDFLREYRWIHDLLERLYPEDEFLIIPARDRERPPGWEKAILEWSGHIIYRKQKPDFYKKSS